jgi:hypothetical protein
MTPRVSTLMLGQPSNARLYACGTATPDGTPMRWQPILEHPAFPPDVTRSQDLVAGLAPANESNVYQVY